MSLMLFLSFMMVAEPNYDSKGVIYGQTEIFEPLAPREFAVAANGDVYILHFENRTVLHYSPEGKRKGEFGGKGQGPGEFSFPDTLRVDDKHVYVTDRGRDLIQVFDLEGKHIKALSLPMGAQADWVKGGWVYGDFLSMNPDDSEPIKISIANEELKEPNVVLEIPRSSETGLRIEMTGSGRPKAKYNPVSDGPRMVVTADGTTVFVRPANSKQIHVIDVASKKVSHVMEYDKKGVPFSIDWGRERFEEIEENMRKRRSPAILEPAYPEHFPSVREMSAMGDGNLMIRRWTGKPDVVEKYEVIDQNGKTLPNYCKDANMPRLLAIRGDNAYFTAHNEEDDGYVVMVPRQHLDEAIALHPVEGERAPRFLMRTN